MSNPVLEDLKFKKDLQWASHIAATAGIIGLLIAIFRDTSEETLWGIAWPVGLALLSFTPDVLLAGKRAEKFGLNTVISRTSTIFVVLGGGALAFVALIKLIF